MRMSRMPAMIVRMFSPVRLFVAFFAIVPVLSHLRYCTRPSPKAVAFLAALGPPLLRSLTLCLRESIDAPPRR